MSTRPRTVLLVDQDDAWREALADVLRTECRVLRAASGETALSMLTREEVDVLLVDLVQPGISAFETLRIARENFELTEVIVTGAEPDVEAAVDAVKLGAFHFAPKSAGVDTVRSLVARALERQSLTRQVQVLSAEASDTTDREFIVGPSRGLQDVVDLVRRVAPLSATVLVLGESGTGKELLARLLHRQGPSPDGPFVAVNLAAIPQDLVESVLFGHEKGAFTGAMRQQIGKFELATGGTLFLDEIGDLRLDLQSKLLRAIQEGEVERIGSARPIKTDFRLIAATNVDLDRAVKEGRFREDLYFRLRVIPITLPPLRDRAEDVATLAPFFLRRYNTKFRKQVEGISEKALKALSSYDWPGNIRELENLVERSLIMGGGADVFLPGPQQSEAISSIGDLTIEQLERSHIRRVLEKTRWLIEGERGAARILGLNPSTLRGRMRKLGIRKS
jgi:two-component system response regulator HydG